MVVVAVVMMMVVIMVMTVAMVAVAQLSEGALRFILAVEHRLEKRTCHVIARRQLTGEKARQSGKDNRLIGQRLGALTFRTGAKIARRLIESPAEQFTHISRPFG